MTPRRGRESSLREFIVAFVVGDVRSSDGRWLQDVLASGSWPGKTTVGIDGAAAAFCLVPWSSDRTLTHGALPLMESALLLGEVTGAQYAQLFDRVGLMDGRGQRYGTQAQWAGGRLVFAKMEDSLHVDDRRASMGLAPLGTYPRGLDSRYASARSTPPVRR